MCAKKMTDEKARRELKKICESTTYARNSRREKNERHEKFNEALNELKEVSKNNR